MYKIAKDRTRFFLISQDCTRLHEIAQECSELDKIEFLAIKLIPLAPVVRLALVFLSLISLVVNLAQSVELPTMLVVK